MKCITCGKETDYYRSYCVSCAEPENKTIQQRLRESKAQAADRAKRGRGRPCDNQ